MEKHQQTYWQVWTLLSPVPRLGKLHRLATREEWGTQDRRPLVHQARQQGAVLSMEDSNTWGHSISELFRPEELAAVFRRLKPRKSPGLDYIFLEFIHHAGSTLKSWFCDLLTSCMCRQLKIPKIWRRALIVAIPKPVKPLGTQRAIVPYLCCVSHLTSWRDSSTLVSNQSIIDTLLPQEQAGFRHGRSAAEKVTLLTQDIEDSFLTKKKAGAVFFDLAAD